MTERQFAILRDLDDERLMRPQELRNRHMEHSSTLAQLVVVGAIERRPRGAKKSYEYRRTQKGSTAVHGWRPIDRMSGRTP